ncbi:MAG: hypothetical protein DRP78_01915 [Candidatus Omnitrophota bacterium]|nr:MAG: hypothetical protein DRP78_01915 [Candidatus Omnitrophota bacterium]
MISDLQILLRLLLSAFLSGVIGYEREVHGREAGLRTTILVGVGSCLMMLTSMHLFDIYQGIAQVDPGRIAAQVVSGIGFLGAGTILQFRASVRGLTTAAGLWAVAGIGLAVGSGFYSAALLSTVVIFIVLFFFTKIVRKIRKDIYHTLKIEINGGIEQLCKIRKVLTDFQVEINDIEVKQLFEDKANFRLKLYLKSYGIKDNQRIVQALSSLSNVVFIGWLK